MPVPRPIIPYDPHFLGDGIEVPLPEPSDELRDQLHTHDGSHVIDYIHFSLAMHKPRRTAVYSACNIDGRRFVKGAGGSKTWKLDDRLGDYQLGGEVYNDTAWDRGHLTKREDVVWGSPKEARDANLATFYFANAAPQHSNFNQDEWKKLEDWILENWATVDHYRLCVFTGPVLWGNDRTLAEGDPELRRAREILPPEKIFIPAAFWKIVTLRDAATDDLAVAAFAMRQTDLWNDRGGSKLLRLSVHQVTVDAVSRWTNLDFGPLHDADVLRISEDRSRFAREATGDMIWPIIRSADDLVTASPERRRAPSARGATRSASVLRSTRSASSSGCGCNDSDKSDVQASIDALARDVARLTEAVATLLPAADASERGVRGARGARPMPADTPAAATDSEDAEEQQFDEVMRLLEVDTTSSDLVRIVGGNEVPAGQFLSTCCLGAFGEFFCTGILVHPRVVITAAHCEADLTRAFFGGPDIPPLGGTGTTMAILKTIVHPQYNDRAFVRNDISVVILEEDCTVTPTPIATQAELAAATDTELVGFGFSDPARPIGFGTKRQVNVPIAAVQRNGSNMRRLESRLGFSSAHEYVAGRKLLGRDSCNGDSGGPSFIDVGGELKVAGVTSRATKEATRTRPCGNGGIYVRLDVYLPWIRSVARQFEITI